MPQRRLDYRVGLETQEFRNQLMSMQADVSNTVNQIQPGLQGQAPAHAGNQGQQRREKTFQQDAGGGFTYNPGFATSAAGSFGLLSAPPGISQDQFQNASRNMLASGLADTAVSGASIAGATAAGVGTFQAASRYLAPAAQRMATPAGQAIGKGIGALAAAPISAIGSATGRGWGTILGGAGMGAAGFAAGGPIGGLAGTVAGGVGGSMSGFSSLTKAMSGGAKVGGAIASGAMKFGLPMAASYVGQEAIMEGAEAVNEFRTYEQTLDRTSWRYMPEGKTDQAGSGFSDGQREQISDFLMDFQQGTNFNPEGIQKMLSQGSQMGAFSGVQGAKDFKNRFKKLSKKVKEITRVFKTSLEDAMDTVQELDQMGYGDINSIQSQMGRLRGYADSSGMSMQETMQTFSRGARLAQKKGLPGRAGADLTTRMRSNIESRIQYGEIDQQTVRQQGGAGRMAMGMSSKMLDFFRSKKGLTMAGAFADSDFQGIDEKKVKQFVSGNTDQSITSMMAENLSENGYAKSQRKLMLNRKKLTSELAESNFAPYMAARMGNNILERQGLDPDKENLQLFFRNQMGMKGEQAKQYARMATDPSSINRRIDAQVRQVNQRAVKDLRQKRWDQLTPDTVLGKSITEPFAMAQQFSRDLAVEGFKQTRSSISAGINQVYESVNQDLLGMPEEVNANLPDVSTEFIRNNQSDINKMVNQQDLPDLGMAPRDNDNSMPDALIPYLEETYQRENMANSVMFNQNGSSLMGDPSLKEKQLRYAQGAGVAGAGAAGALRTVGSLSGMIGSGASMVGMGGTASALGSIGSAVSTAGKSVMPAAGLAFSATGTIANIERARRENGTSGAAITTAGAGLGAAAGAWALGAGLAPFTGGASLAASSLAASATVAGGAYLGSEAGYAMSGPAMRQTTGTTLSWAGGQAVDSLIELGGAGTDALYSLWGSQTDWHEGYDYGDSWAEWSRQPTTEAEKKAAAFRKLQKESPRRALAQSAYGEGGAVSEGDFANTGETSFSSQLQQAGENRIEQLQAISGPRASRKRREHIEQRIDSMSEDEKRKQAIRKRTEDIKESKGLDHNAAREKAKEEIKEMSTLDVQQEVYEQYQQVMSGEREMTEAFKEQEGRADLENRTRSIRALQEDVDLGSWGESTVNSLSESTVESGMKAMDQYLKNHSGDKAPNMTAAISAGAKEMFDTEQITDRQRSMAAEAARKAGYDLPTDIGTDISEMAAAKKISGVGDWLRTYRSKKQGFNERLAGMMGGDAEDMNMSRMRKALAKEDTSKAVKMMLRGGNRFAGANDSEVKKIMKKRVEGLSDSEAETALRAASRLRSGGGTEEALSNFGSLQSQAESIREMGAAAPINKAINDFATDIGMDPKSAKLSDIAERVMYSDRENLKNGDQVLSGTGNEIFSASKQFFEKLAEKEGGMSQSNIASAVGLESGASKEKIMQGVKQKFGDMPDLQKHIKQTLNSGDSAKKSAQKSLQNFMTAKINKKGSGQETMESGVAGSEGIDKAVMESLQKQIEPLQELADAVNRLAQNAPG